MFKLRQLVLLGVKQITFKLTTAFVQLVCVLRISDAVQQNLKECQITAFNKTTSA